jgi:DNA invertase Pin-like site-specific DNA recombinase
MNTIIGYARVSGTDQDLSIQQAALKAAGCAVIRAEKRDGAAAETREELRTVLDFLREGDVLVVTRIDRLARNIGDLQDIVRTIRTRGASLKATEQPIDTSTAAGECFLNMLGVFAEFETSLRKERQFEDIAHAKAAGVYKGHRASSKVEQVRSLEAQGMGASEIAKTLKIGRASVYRHRATKRTWELVVDAVVALGGRARASEIGDYIVSTTPHYKRTNLHPDLSLLSVNSRARINFFQNKNHPRRTDSGNEHDALYKDGEGRDAIYVLYDPAIHGVWEITADGNVDPV